MNQNLIQWPKAKYWTKTWNPVIGCMQYSPACDNCYAKAWAQRFGQSFEPHETKQVNPPRSGTVFVGNMTDLFGSWMPVSSIMGLFSKLWYFPTPHSCAVPFDATYLFCTKRVGSMCRALEPYTEMPHCYFGFTAENFDTYQVRSRYVEKIPERHKLWLSAEPLLGPIYPCSNIMRRLKWCVIGCESGPHRRRCELEWVERIVYDCMLYGTPVFVKQLDINGRCETDISKFPAHLRIRQVPWATKQKGGAE